MKKLLGFLFIALIINSSGFSQTKYIIQFRDKGSNPFSLDSPSDFLSQRAIDRRSTYSIALDSTDLPVTPRYLDSIRSAGNVTVLNASKWLNSVSIQTTDATALAKINSFPFVRSVVSIAPKLSGSLPGNKFNSPKNPLMPFQKEMEMKVDHFNYGFSRNQVEMHHGDFLHNIGLRGQGMVIGMLDGGYRNYLTVNSLDSARANGQILGVYDFVIKDSSVNEDHQHGMQCLSVIAANVPGIFVGAAPKGNFYLFRSEDASSEYPIEEHNWVCAAERVDSVGGDVISSSLGYNTFDAPFTSYDHTYSDMNGNTTMAAMGADLACKKGILVVNSAGNEGNNSWGKIITPADGDSVLAVGAVTADSIAASFTSRGPSSDGQVKPDVASKGVGTIVQFPDQTIAGSNGTSFAAPNISGLATCLWQGFREFNNMKIIHALRLSGHRAANPNDTIGYGIPDMKKALMILLKEYSTASGDASNCQATLNWSSKDMKDMKYEIERKVPGQSLFLKIAELNGTGNIFSNQTYQFTDDLSDLPAGNISYRIRQVIDTSIAGFTADYIDTINVVSSTNCATGTKVTLMPNPARGPVTIKISTLNDVPNLLVRMFNSKGQLVFEMKKSKTAGTAFYELPVSHLAAGKYYVSVYSGDELIDTNELIKL